MEMKRLFQLGILLLAYDSIQSAEILAVFSFPGVSAFHFNKGIVMSLLEAHHRITFLTPFASKITPMNNLTAIELGTGLPKLYHRFSSEELANYTIYKRMEFLFSFEEMYCAEIMKTDVIKEALAFQKKYDIMLTQAMFIPQCQLKIAEILNIPVIGTIAFRKEMPMLNTGSPLDPGLYSHVLSELGDEMEFPERLSNVWYYIWSLYFDARVIQPKAQAFCRKYFPKSPALPTISPHLYFIDSHLSILPRALAPNLIEVAGIHIGPTQPLDEQMETFIKEAEHGVILFTLSSLVLPSGISANTTSAFVEVFSSIPQRVIWKYDGVLENLSDNVMLADWVPQRDILEHKNVVAFISHCGLSSMLEAIHTATPVIAIPLFTDQPSNAMLLENLGVAIRLPSFRLTKKGLLKALDNIVNDTSYRDNMKSLSEKFKERERSPEETVVFWTEYVLRYEGATHLRPAAMDIPLYQYLLLDVMLVACGALFWCSIAFYYLYKLLFKSLKRLLGYQLRLYLD